MQRLALADGRIAGIVFPLYIPITWKKGHPDPSDLEDVFRYLVER